MKEIEIDMEPLEKMGIKYEVVHNDFTHDSYRAQEVQAKNKRVVNAVRIGAKLVSMAFIYVYMICMYLCLCIYAYIYI